MDKIFRLILITVCFLVLLVNFAFALTASQIEKRARSCVVDFIVEKFPAYQNDEIKVSFSYATGTFKALAKETEEITFKVLELYPNYKPFGSAVIPVQVYRADEPYKRLFIKAKVEIYRPVVVATRKLKKYDILTATDLALKRVDLATISKEFFVKKDRLIGRQTKTIIREGKPILTWMVRVVPLISRGDEVKIVVTKGNVRVGVLGRARGEGYLGKPIKVRKLDSRREFVATVTGTGEVEVN